MTGRDPLWTPFAKMTRPPNRYYDPEKDGLVYENSRYRVFVREYPPDEPGCGLGNLVHLSIRRIDGSSRRPWRDYQRIKNELIGPEEEAIELYPAESRLVDTANQYHLYAIRGQRMPFGFTQRLLGNCPLPGGSQDPWEEGEEPEDVCYDQEALLKAGGLL